MQIKIKKKLALMILRTVSTNTSDDRYIIFISLSLIFPDNMRCSNNQNCAHIGIKINVSTVGTYLVKVDITYSIVAFM